MSLNKIKLRTNLDKINPTNSILNSKLQILSAVSDYAKDITPKSSKWKSSIHLGLHSFPSYPISKLAYTTALGKALGAYVTGLALGMKYTPLFIPPSVILTIKLLPVKNKDGVASAIHSWMKLGKSIKKTTVITWK